MAEAVPVYLETGTKWVFACAVDWPGWARRGKDAGEALAALEAYHGRGPLRGVKVPHPERP